MWCPKCKNEYIEGITKCIDCHIDLVPELTAENLKDYHDISEDFDYQAKDSDLPEADKSEKKSARVYVDKSAAYEDMKSTAYTFLLVGGLGIIFLILFGMDVISLSMVGYMKTLMLIVMGTLFMVFLVIGIRYLRKLQSAREDISNEADLTVEITEWFTNQYSAAFIDENISDTSLSEELLYFSRYEQMMKRLQEQYPDLEETFADHLIEILYGKIYSDR